MAGKGQMAGAKVRKARFLVAFRRYKIVALAARRIGTDRSNIYRWCREDAKFKEQFMNAQEEILDMLERELHKLGTGQYRKPLVSAGKVVAYEEIHSETALLALLRAYRPRLYRERMSMEVMGEGGGPVTVVKKEVTGVLIADVTKILVEAGVIGSDGTFGGARQPALSAENPQPENALDNMRSRQQ